MPNFLESGIRGNRLRPGYSSPYTPVRGMSFYGPNPSVLPPGGGGIRDGLPPVIGGDGASSLPGAIYEQRVGAEQKSEADYERTKQAIEDAYQAGQMSDEEYNRLQTESFESTRAQFGHLRRQTTEGAYGRVNTGALRGEIRDIGVSEIGTLARGRRGIQQERVSRQFGATQFRAGALADLMSRRQIPRLDIPSGFTPQETVTAITGKGGGGRFNPMITPRLPFRNGIRY